MQTVKKEAPRSLRDQIVEQAYEGGRHQAQFLYLPRTQCPRCGSDFVFLMQETSSRRIICCQLCGIQYHEKDRLAA